MANIIKTDSNTVNYAGKKLNGIYDFSDSQNMTMRDVDLTDATIVGWPSGRLNLFNVTGLKKLDLTKTATVNIRDVDLGIINKVKASNKTKINNYNSDTKKFELVEKSSYEVFGIKYDRGSKEGVDVMVYNEEEIDLSGKALKGKHDFSKCKEVDLLGADLTGATIVGWPSESVDLSKVKGLPKKLDFSKIEYVHLRIADLTGVTIVGWPSEFVDLAYAKGLTGKLDFSKCEVVELFDADLSNAEIVAWPSDHVNLSYAKGLAGKLDFDKCESVAITANTDFSNISKIIVYENTKFFECVALNRNNISISEFIKKFNLGKRVKNADGTPVQKNSRKIFRTRG